MFSLQRLFGKDQEFFDLLEASAEQCRTSIEALERIVSNPGNGTPSLEELISSRRREKEITTKIGELLSSVSVIALEPEDIQRLSNSLYKIPKTTEKFAERYALALTRVKNIDFSPQVKLLKQATNIIVQMLKELRDKSEEEKIAEQNESLQQVEGEADKLMLSVLKELYAGKTDPLLVVVLKELYELLERVVDRCRDAGNVISNIALKG
ncbi:MAG TPA: DUF47 family protein [Verrucomicrobiae bacterium]|nr:DUF47 family protein [Verrucomicrobiae bacterium]